MFPYKKVLIIGSGGSGKTTFAKDLQKGTGLPLIHLDKEFWLPHWQRPNTVVWQQKLAKLLEQDAFIMDGNFGATLDERMKHADLVIFMDISRIVCTWSVFSRSLHHHGKTRSDMGSGCKEAVDWHFIKWVWDFPKKYRPHLLETINRYPKVDKITFSSRKQAYAWLKQFQVSDKK